MNPLEQARQTIDDIDRQMASLFEKRMDAVKIVADYKQKNGKPILDKKREELVVQKNLKRIQNSEYAPFYADYMRHTMTISRQFQAQLLGHDHIGYPELIAPHACIALKALFPHGVPQQYATRKDVFAAVGRGEVSAGLIPVEEGSPLEAVEIMDLCFHNPVYIQSFYKMPLAHSLLALPGSNLWDLHTVYCHPQTIRQNQVFLNNLNLTALPTTSDTQAAQMVAQSNDHSIAALATPLDAEKYGLTELAQDIRPSGNSSIKFLVLTSRCPTDGNHFSLLFTLDEQVGKLAPVIEEIGKWGFDMDTIQSHPRPGMPSSYYFYAELVGSLQQAETLVSALRNLCQTVRILAVYHR